MQENVLEHQIAKWPSKKRPRIPGIPRRCSEWLGQRKRQYDVWSPTIHESGGHARVTDHTLEDADGQVCNFSVLEGTEGEADREGIEVGGQGR
jgi:hypothetical protein